MKMDSILGFTVAILLVCAINGRAIDELDNSLQAEDIGEQPEKPAFVKIGVPLPPKIIRPFGSSLELECEVTGTPAPTVQWVHTSNPTKSINDFEENLIAESNPDTFVRVVSRLHIDHVGPGEHTYICIGRSAAGVAHTSTTVYSTPGSLLKPHNITEFMAMANAAQNAPRKARIEQFYTMIFESMGSNVILPCKVGGRPYPELYWLDREGNVISGQDPRFRVLSSGGLLITSLRWTDMGPYTCVARNAVSKDSIETFVYPVLKGE